jgi:hypothetical protein
MKKPVSITSLLFIAICSCLLFSACKKDKDIPTVSNTQQIIGKWSINRIQEKIFYNGVFVRDTIIKQNPQPYNNIIFGSAGEFQYKFNNASSDIGIYSFAGDNNVNTAAGSSTYQWKILTLTNVLFTVMSSTTNDPNYPGAMVERYQTFVR